jgi:predicted RNA-binding Zn-ribbon protein involved in translation (DUF1610 family)
VRIKKINRQNRRDFYADFECEHCGFIQPNKYGYDDSNFHLNVIPQMKCPQCGKTADESYQPRQTKYPDGMTV